MAPKNISFATCCLFGALRPLDLGLFGYEANIFTELYCKTLASWLSVAASYFFLFFFCRQNLSKDLDDTTPRDTYKHIYVLQKLISQANRILKFQQNQDSSTKKESHVQHQANNLANSGLTRFVKPTKNPPSIVIEEASAQTLSLVARRKKLPIVGESFLFEEERLRILENQQKSRNSAMEDLQSQMENDAQLLSSAEKQTQYEHDLQRMGIPNVAGIGPDGARPPNERLVHLDLKGAPPKVSSQLIILAPQKL